MIEYPATKISAKSSLEIIMHPFAPPFDCIIKHINEFGDGNLLALTEAEVKELGQLLFNSYPAGFFE